MGNQSIITRLLELIAIQILDAHAAILPDPFPEVDYVRNGMLERSTAEVMYKVSSAKNPVSLLLTNVNLFKRMLMKVAAKLATWRKFPSVLDKPANQLHGIHRMGSKF